MVISWILSHFQPSQNEPLQAPPLRCWHFPTSRFFVTSPTLIVMGKQNPELKNFTKKYCFKQNQKLRFYLASHKHYPDKKLGGRVHKHLNSNRINTSKQHFQQFKQMQAHIFRLLWIIRSHVNIFPKCYFLSLTRIQINWLTRDSNETQILNKLITEEQTIFPHMG